MCRAVGRSGSPTEIREVAKRFRRHEENHAEPYLRNPNTQIRFGVWFVQDSRTGNLAVRPFMSISGEVQVGARRRSLAAPENLSPGDSIAN